MSEITIRAKSVLKVTDGVNNVDFMADKGVIFSDFISRLPGVSGLSEQNKQLIAKLGLISIAAEEGDMAKVKELIPPSCADVVREMRTEAVDNLCFPVALRKMWSGGEVQDLLKEQANQTHKQQTNGE